MGLKLNINKCEVISTFVNGQSQICVHPLDKFKQVDADEGTLLGAPLSTKRALSATLTDRIHSLAVSAGRLKLLFAHDALLILKNTMSLPSLLHILRSAPCHGHPSLQLFDDKLRESLSAVLNVDLEDVQWCQASLPVRDGGLGIRSAVQLAPSAFFSSAAASAPLVAKIHTGTGLTISDPGQASSLTAWSALGAQTPTSFLPLVLKESGILR